MAQRSSHYSVYNVEQKKRTKINPMPDVYPDLPDGRFEIIYADPPWHYGGKMQYDKTCTIKHNGDFRRKVFISSAAFKYPTLRTSEMMSLDVQSIAAEDSLLFMWTTNPHLAQAIDLGHAWGFEYKTVVFVWDKMIHNPGQYTLSNCELCLLFKHGRIPCPRGARNIQQLVHSPRRTHSRKPDEVRKNIEAMFPTQSKIELFARSAHDGWDNWGLDMLEEEPTLFNQAGSST